MSERDFPRAIIFFGPDGAGKTTQAHLVLKLLKKNGLRVKLVWLRGRHSIAFYISAFFMRLGYYGTFESPNGTSYKAFDPDLLPKIRSLWKLIEFISVLPWIILRFHVPLFLGYNIVAERYVVDTAVYLGYWLDLDFSQSPLIKVLLAFIPKDSFLIHMDAETNVLLKRRFNDTINKDYIEFQRKAYAYFAERLGAVTINTSEFQVVPAYFRILNRLSR